MSFFAPGSLLAQVRPSSTTNSTAFVATIRTQVTAIKVCNTSGSSATCRIFHDDAATQTFDQTTALYYDRVVPSGATFEVYPGSEIDGIYLAKNAVLAVRSSSGNALTYHVYGVTAPQR